MTNSPALEQSQVLANVLKANPALLSDDFLKKCDLWEAIHELGKNIGLELYSKDLANFTAYFMTDGQEGFISPELKCQLLQTAPDLRFYHITHRFEFGSEEYLLKSNVSLQHNNQEHLAWIIETCELPFDLDNGDRIEIYDIRELKTCSLIK